MDISTIENWLTNTFGESTFYIKVFFVVFITLLVSLIWRRLFRKIHSQLEKTKNDWDDALIVSVNKPLNLLIWGVGAWVLVEKLFVFNVNNNLQEVGIVFLVSWFAIRFIREAEKNIIASHKNKQGEERIDPSTVEAISKLLRVSVSITTSLVILQTMGVSISAVLAFGGIGGIAIGFAAKDLLSNFFGGLIIYLDRPFSVGDWIRSADREIEGTVEYIGWRQTRIRTFDKRPLYVPNQVFNSITVENPSRMTNRRIYETIGVRYDDMSKMKVIVEQVKQMLIAHPEIDTNQTMIVNFNTFSNSSIDFFIYTFTKTTDWIAFHEIKQDVLLKIADIIEEQAAEMAYPTQRLQIDDLEKLAVLKENSTERIN